MSTIEIPAIDNRIVCIVDNEQVGLAAVLSSYLVKPGTYFPLFLFPRVRAFTADVVNSDQDDYVAKIIGDSANVLINNALSRVGGYNYMILAGLSDDQKSYISYPKNSHTIQINDVSEVREKLSQAHIPISDVLPCRSDELLKGLLFARMHGTNLVIDENAPPIPSMERRAGGLVVTESTANNAACVVAVNYALALGANLEIVKPLDRQEFRSIQNFIQKWRDNNCHNQVQKVLDKISQRVGQLHFEEFQYATFFTEGLPYSLGIDNVIPCSHVHLKLHADLFVFNGLLFEASPRFGSAVVFSLKEFFAGGESQWLVDFLRKQNFYVRALVDMEATVSNLDFYASHFAYDILHIASHGGEVPGFEIKEEFTDRHGKKHIVEYDAVQGIAHVEGDAMAAINIKAIFLRFDGFRWMSPELEAERIPQYVFEDMRKALFGHQKKSRCLRCIPKSIVPSSCAIVCSDSIHQGTFQSLASHSSPIIFNNTCWSWYEVAAFFLASGARSYVGTLWGIRTDVAVAGAGVFYENLFTSTVLDAFHKATQAIKSSTDRNVYVLWGLHLTTTSMPVSGTESHQNVFQELVRSTLSWIDHAEKSRIAEVKRNSIEIFESLKKEIMSNFRDDVHQLPSEINERLHSSSGEA